MDTRFEIIVEINGEREYLDTYQTEPISLNFNIADLTDIPARNSSYSKSIKIPETKHNRWIFGNISDLASSTEFNPNKKTRAWVLVDGFMVLEGYIQLRFVYVDIFKDKTEYEVVIFADNDNFFKALGEKFLTDLDWSELNHIWSGANIRASWTASNPPYYYPLIDYARNFDYTSVGRLPIPANAQSPRPIGGGVSDADFYPATNVKYMIDKIFQDTGYTYQSNFLNSDLFKNLYIPFNQKDMTNPTNGDFLFSAGRLTSVSFSTQYFAGNTIPQNPSGQNYVKAYPSVNPAGSTNYFYNVQPYDWGVYRLPFNSEAAPNGDPQGVYNPTLYQFQAPATGNVRAMSFIVEFDITFQFGIDPDLLTTSTSPQFGPANTPACWIGIRRSRNALGVAANNQWVPVQGFAGRIPFNDTNLIKNLELLDPIFVDVYEEGVPEPSILQKTRYKRVRGAIETDFLSGTGQFVNNYRLFNNELVWVEMKLGIDSGEYREQINQQQGVGVGWNGSGNGYFVGNSIITANAIQGTAQRPNVPPGNPLGTFSSSIKFRNNIQEVLIVGDLIDYNQIIPKQIKNKDFFSSIVKMFNLYIEPSKELDNVLIIEPRDDYYAAGVIKDWTGKLDLTQPIREQILAETQNREIRLKYRDDNDFFNEDFARKENIRFGEYRQILDNDFTIGIKTIEPIFSPTPLVLMPNSNKIIIPKIGRLENNLLKGTEHNIRILTRYQPNQTSNWTFGGLTTSVSPNFPDYAVITSQGIAPQRTQSFNVGDVININQNDNGATYPALQGSFEVLEVINNRTIVISLTPRPTWVGYVGGIATPLPGVIGSDRWYFIDGNQTFTYSFYPYIGHFSHPLYPNYDLNYAQSFGYYHPINTITNRSLYNDYWKTFIDEITDKDSRIITCQMKLDGFDISEFRFSDNIFINGQYYKVNKISDYDPTTNRPCKVELIKSKSFIIPRDELQFGGVFGRYEAPGGDLQPSINGVEKPIGVLTTNNTNSIRRADALVAGRENQVTSGRSIVVGDRNIVYSDQNYVMGNGNLVNLQSENNLVVGSNNELSSGVDGSIVFGSNMKVQSSNTIAFGGVLVSMANQVSASKNEVLSPYNMKPANFISGSKNSVFEWGSQDPINYISGDFYIRED